MCDVMIEVNDLHKWYGNNEILKGIDLQIHKGEKVVIIGPSGSGKSTLLNCLNYLERPTSGQVLLEGTAFEEPGTKYNEKHVAALRVHIGMVFQNFNLFPHKTALHNVMTALITIRKLPKNQAQQIAEKYLAKVGLSERLHHYPSQLSGGQKQRVAIARALAMEPKAMLFDEATSALDPELVGEVLQVIRTLANEGMTIVMVTHEMKFAREIGDRILFMDQGCVLEENTPAELFQNPQHPRTRAFLQEVFSH